MSFDSLRLDQQLCHPLYSAANAIVRLYKPLLKKLDLTYPQYLVMLALWQESGVNISRITQLTYLDSGTLTPILQRLTEKDLIAQKTLLTDKRNKLILLTKKGQRLKEKAIEVPRQMGCLLALKFDELHALKKLMNNLYRVLAMAEVANHDALEDR